MGESPLFRQHYRSLDLPLGDRPQGLWDTSAKTVADKNCFAKPWSWWRRGYNSRIKAGGFCCYNLRRPQYLPVFPRLPLGLHSRLRPES